MKSVNLQYNAWCRSRWHAAAPSFLSCHHVILVQQKARHTLAVKLKAILRLVEILQQRISVSILWMSLISPPPCLDLPPSEPQSDASCPPAAGPSPHS